MSISAISSLISASGGKAALSALGELLPESGLPLDFAALLAEQIPSGTPTDPALLTGEAIQANARPDGALIAEIVSRAESAKDIKTLPVDEKSPVPQGTEERAEDILGALAAGFGTTGTSASGESDGKKDSREKHGKVTPASEQSLADVGMAVAQYIVPPAMPPLQNRLQNAVDRDKAGVPEQAGKTADGEISGDDARSQLADQRALNASTSPATGAPAAKAGEPQVIPRSDAANAAILAGDTPPGNSGNTPAFATALAAASGSGGSAMATPPVQPPAVNSALGSPNWAQDFGKGVIWLAKNDQQVAQININPPQLGPVQISISLNGDVATTSFASPHAEVRQAIQDSLPQLREMFSTAGISLGQANVGTQLPSQNREAAFQFANEARSSRETAILSPDSHASASPAGIPIQRGRGLVDLFA